MSRLDSFINRMSAQRDMLNHVRDTYSLPEGGAIFEIGLGNGRTFSHLRENFPDRRIIAFDRKLASHADGTPDRENFVEGEIRETGQAFIGAEAALVHADIGTGYDDKDAVTLTWLPQMVAGMLASGGYAVSGLPLSHPELEELPPLPNVRQGRYFHYRRR
ncbi:class I SAM-dependent methyltransferase [Rhizobium sp. SSA_523]|uniref:class I SAM-dependent methyltransferase n=1 Tax=Rhizobium sp. SSA_523 TaxID=2952477 RepID=UPI0020916C82|nr:class I SAM-dependent methyltransferase [Rhizobium sp. SSA_523]MCO5732349.1 class I SAM-dependent methyltransferase [Rhizobium sp. SSA_523]WKC21252.1 class I SAM-dependent methyltransferase [Rhizobium sp. SSA_523]